MVKVCAYERPRSLDEALTTLERPGAVPIGGGTRLNQAKGSEPVTVVDLQAAGLDGIRRDGDDRVVIGATTTLADLASSQELPDVIREAARRERPSTLRTLSTLGGCVASGDFESELLAALLVHRAAVRIADRHDVRLRALSELLTHPGWLADRIITDVEIETDGRSAVSRVARSPMDRAIIAAVARRDPTGIVLLAFSGVAGVPILMTPEGLDPPGDFRGSSEYRRAMAETLAARACEAVR